VADKKGIAKRQTRRRANTTIAMRSRTKTKKVEIVKEDSPFQFRQNVVVSHGNPPNNQSNTEAL
jgi:hypothetical protein